MIFGKQNKASMRETHGEELYNPKDIKKQTRNDYEMLTIIKKDLFKKVPL